MSDTKAKKIVELTQEGYEELKQEMDELVNVKLPQVIDRVAKARDHGDLSENSEYQNARDDQSIVEARIAEIEAVLANAVVVKNTKSTSKIGVGSTVIISLEKNPSKKFTYTIVGEFESDPEEGKISSVSPIGKALVSKKKGDKVKVQAPAGEIVYLVEDIK